MDAAAAHVLVFPWPRQGHINPMLHLAAALVDAGVRVTFLHTDHTLRRLARAPPPPPPRPMRVLSVPDGLPYCFLDLMASICDTSRPAYRALLLSSLLSSGAPVTCVVADGTMPFAVQAAEELGVPALAFAAHSACSYLALLCTPRLDELGETAFPADDPVRGVPGMEGFLRRRDLPRELHCAEQGGSDPMVLKVAEAIARSCKAARVLLLNTAASMERPALAHVASRAATDVFAVGPLHAASSSRSAASSNTSLWQEDEGCMAWLDGQGDRSVVYVSLGSLAVITHGQFTEFLAGLAATGHAFLWVLRPDLVRPASPGLLLREAVAAAAGGGDRARVVEWAPQRDVLRHRAVGCFLTHAGWNSTLECAAEGVPMVCWPFFADQQTNSRFVGAVWGWT
ncbi:hypothetical protein CFC21_095402 [Triticum aestivum]|uniref:Glycosyltransferase n=2 Tax=Triticum aestivum TaxID=4565 RepID=A0A3B6R7X6_WHEAT|nr:hypothetical protein CFC21_095402 [Triticum aestivum]